MVNRNKLDRLNSPAKSSVLNNELRYVLLTNTIPRFSGTLLPLRLMWLAAVFTSTNYTVSRGNTWCGFPVILATKFLIFFLCKQKLAIRNSTNFCEWRLKRCQKQGERICKLTDSFWQMISDWMKWLFPRVRKSIHDRDWMKTFPYEFFMRSILSENLSRYEIKRYYIYIYISSQTWHNQITLDPRHDLAKWSFNTVYIRHLNSKSRWQRINLILRNCTVCEILLWKMVVFCTKMLRCFKN